MTYVLYRSKLGKTSFPEVSSVEESPYRVVQSISGELVFVNINITRQETNLSGTSGKCLPQDSKREVVSSTSSDEDHSEAADTLLSFYLPPDRQHPLEESPTDSMMAFKLTTPPKEARLNFLNVTTSLQ